MIYTRKPETPQDIADCFDGIPLKIMEAPFDPLMKDIYLKFCKDGALEVFITKFGEDNAGT